MSDILVSTDQLLVTNDKFIVDNMLTEDDLDLDLDPNLWNDLSSNDSNSCDLVDMTDLLMATDSTGLSSLSTSQTPETPPSSDRSTPPNFDDLTLGYQFSPKMTTTTTTHENFFVQNHNPLPNVALVSAINLCPMSPLSPIVPNQTSILAMRTQNDLNLIKSNVNSGDNCLDLRALRREARKLRNREAANISRKRKKDYIEGLEHRINDLTNENSVLKGENERLKQRVLLLETNHDLICKKGFNYSSIENNCNCRPVLSASTRSNKKAALSLLAVVFMLGLNLAPFSGILITNDKTLDSIEDNSRPTLERGSGRSLLWTSNDNRVDIDVIAFNTSRFRNNTTADVNCKTYINQSESLRLDTDLRYWVSRVELEKEEVFRHKQPRRRANGNSHQLKDRFNKPIPLPRLKAWIQKRTETENDFNDYVSDSYKKTALKMPQINYEELLAAVHRRDDTFYLLSYSSKDHLIIPPIANSTDIRPRFSLLMPLISTLNESQIRGTNVTYNQISIMQIDCQVINTKMVLFNNWPAAKVPVPGVSATANNATSRPRVTANDRSNKQRMQK